MSNQIFDRNKPKDSYEPIRRLRNKKLSMDDIFKHINHPSIEMRKTYKKTNNQIQPVSKLERYAPKKNKVRQSVTNVNSLALTHTNSPFKYSLKNSMIFKEQSKLKLYRLYYQIGFGGFGRVWKISNKETMRQYAMKQISKQKVIQKNNIDPILNQRRILSTLNHPFLINMQRSFQDIDHLYLVMDYLRGGDLRYHICYKQSFNEKEIKFIMANIIVGLEYIHSKHFIHKDLKPQNIVFEENGYVRITDFGIARSQKLQCQTPLNRHQSSGTPVYMAPQILFKKEYSYQSDYYALGVMMFELVFGKRPYEGKNRGEIRQEMLRNEIALIDSDLPADYNPNLANLINRLLKMDPEQRLGRKGIQQIKQHPYFWDLKWKKLQKKQLKPPFIPNVICETKEYLDEIALFNEINQENNNENLLPIQHVHQQRFKQYDFEKKHPYERKNKLKKMGRVSQKKMHAL